MARSFISTQHERSRPPGPGRGALDDNSLDKLLADCRSHKPGDKLPNGKALEYLRSWIESGEVQYLHHIVVGNIRLMIKCAHRYAGPELPIADLVQVAAVGFMRGLKAFDISQADKGPVANYATIWARKEMLEYINENGRTVRISVRTINAAKKALKLLEAEVQRMEYDRLPLDHVMADRPPSERVGALDYFGRNVGLEDARTMDCNPELEDWDNGSRQPRSTSVLEMQRFSTPPAGSPAESPRGDEAMDIVVMACRGLPEDTRRLIYAYYQIEPYNFAAECQRLHLEHSDAVAVVARSVSQLRRNHGRR